MALAIHESKIGIDAEFKTKKTGIASGSAKNKQEAKNDLLFLLTYCSELL